jgi:predicted MFS family arabinose efflux permease
LVPLAISAALIAMFLYIQARVAKSPLMPLSLFQSRALSVANLVMALLGVVFFSMWYFLTLYLQQVHGYSPIKAGVLFFPMGCTIIVGAQTAARLVTDWGPRRVLMIGLILTTGGFFWLAQLSASSSYAAGVLPASLLTTFGAGLCFTPLAAAATSGVPAALAGLASGVLNTSRQVGGSIGLAALATLATARTNDVLAAHDARRPAAVAFTDGYDRAFLVAAFVTLVAMLSTTLLPKQPRPPAAQPVSDQARPELGTPTPAVAD